MGFHRNGPILELLTNVVLRSCGCCPHGLHAKRVRREPLGDCVYLPIVVASAALCRQTTTTSALPTLSQPTTIASGHSWKKIETKQIDQPVSCRQDQEERRHRTENSKIGFIQKNRYRGYVWMCDYVVDGTRYGLSLCSFGSDSATAGWKNSGGKKLHSITWDKM